MKLSELPIPFTKSVPDFKAREVLGRNPGLTPEQVKVLEKMDINDQVAQFAASTSCSAWNFCLVLLMIFLAFNGVRVGRYIQSWLTPPTESVQHIESSTGTVPARTDR
jgi:hypothetical protein